jgi:hypothetical protein
MRPRVALLLLLVGTLLLGVLGPVGPAAADDDDGDPEAVYPLDSFPPTANDNAVLQWNEEALQCIRATRPGPTIVARSLFVLHNAIYDAWVAYDEKAKGTRLGFGLRRPRAEWTAANKRQAVSHAAMVALSDVFPACQADFAQQLASLGYSPADSTTAAMVGQTAGRAVVDYRRTDGANQTGGYADTTGYQPRNSWDKVNDPWRWQPLCVPLPPPGATSCQGIIQQPLTPHWKLVTPFSPDALPTVQIPAPRKTMADTVDDILRESASLTDRKKMIAEYWADGPGSELPPGHWNLFAQWVSRRYRHSLDQDARLFVALNGAMLDVSITAWKVKYGYDFVRPVTGVRYWKAGKTITAWRGPYLGIGPLPGETWQPYQRPGVVTPGFPEYYSGHSSFSAAGAAVLKDFRGAAEFNASITLKAGSSVIEPRTATHPGTPAADVTLRWATFEDACREAGASRKYGGIHWTDGDYYANDIGKKLGEGAYAWAKKLWEGG